MGCLFQALGILKGKELTSSSIQAGRTLPLKISQTDSPNIQVKI